MSKKMTYQEAMTELENIISGIEEENISIDVLSSKVKRATELIKICKTRLYKTDEEIQKVLRELEDL